MDYWFSRHPKFEREFQQIVVWENNNSSIATSTDYFIVDIEYANTKDGRFDMVAVQWDSDASTRKLQSGYLPKLCFIEMKYGDSALTGISGMLEHVNQWKKYLTVTNIGKIKNEMLTLFQQKRDIGLIAGLEDNLNDVKNFSDEIECFFLLANHDPSSRKFKKIIEELKGIKIHGEEVKFCVSNFMGYGLYKENVIKLADFQERFKMQICSQE